MDIKATKVGISNIVNLANKICNERPVRIKARARDTILP